MVSVINRLATVAVGFGQDRGALGCSLAALIAGEPIHDGGCGGPKWNPHVLVHLPVLAARLTVARSGGAPERSGGGIRATCQLQRCRRPRLTSERMS